jgi:polyphosphate kinase
MESFDGPVPLSPNPIFSDLGEEWLADNAESPKLNDPTLFLNRELSLLEFQRRVLALSRDPSIPLLERLRFLTICSTNLDEFFEVRVSGLKEQKNFGIGTVGVDGLTPQDTLLAVTEQAHALIAEQYTSLQSEIFPALAAQGIHVLRREVWSKKLKNWARSFFLAEVLPVLTPIGIDPSHPFPRVLNKSLNFIVTVEGEDAYGRSSGIAVVQVPRCLPRVIEVPAKLSKSPHTFILLSAIVHAHVDELFLGMKVTACYAFRATRNSELWVEEEEIDDLLHALKGELPTRNYGEAVRLEVAKSCSPEIAQFLLSRLNLQEEDLYRVNGPVNLHRLNALCKLVDRPDLKYQSFFPTRAPQLERGVNLFETISRGDILLHHPYESFLPVLELVRQAASDPAVLAIKLTLYRTGSKSPLVEALIEAARNGKEVTAVIELRARFDEARNIDLATQLQEAGANVVYGIVGYKTHSKMMLIVRREQRRLKRYVHLSTGNYHASTARTYTDFGLMTTDADIGEDIHKLFVQLTGLGQVLELKKLDQSPFNLHQRLFDLIANEIKEANAGRRAHIMARMNSLVEPRLIQALYRASQAGVEIDLIVRGICCLCPNVPMVSENIRVRSILGRFLEHSRAYFFHASGDKLTFLSSADWMPRNLFRRAEICFPIEDPELKARVLHEAFAVYIEDNMTAWELEPDGSYTKVVKDEDDSAHSAQETLLSLLANKNNQPMPSRQKKR